ncbi:hypothetical protein GCM10023188_05390 [Pontibacter saemangeumensis]|uniref:histidine kinase n=1 Tax=Pontibacter saemangeumensis TaxID=1084525 RepID=A0ABP8L8M2_9BACT
MKAAVLLCFFFAFVQLKAQHKADRVFQLQQIPEEGVLLDTGWKYQAGDNPAWAEPGFDDAQWQPINPTQDIHELTQVPENGIGWFRLHLSLDTTVRKQQLALLIQQSGASEIYLNGTLIHRFGSVSIEPGEVKAYDPMWRPVMVPFTKEAHQVLAVRYALEPGLSYTTMFETSNPALRISINNLITAIENHEYFFTRLLIFWTFMIGACALLIFLHTAFYVFHPQQKANLSFALFAFFFIAQNIIRVWIFVDGHVVSSRFLLYNTCFSLLLIADMFLLTAIYQLSNTKRDSLFLGLLILVVISVFFIIPQYGWGWIVGGAFLEVLIKLNILRVALQSANRGKRGAWFIAWGAVACLLFFVIFLSLGVLTREFLIGVSPFRSMLYVISVLSIPIATSIYLGLDFAFINNTLKKKLEEVEELSQKTISQEKEKQELLASQNETLERQVEERTAALQESLEELRSTQVQLIQKEKMASLGELMAGIAHEIQNPLNFINNFSEVNKELIEEMQENLHTGQVKEAGAIASGLRENSIKISHHGKRADAIVKNMLEHSRTTKGEKQLTDINALVDEYLRLAYHGVRAKNKAFCAVIKTDFGARTGPVNIVPQDFGRVLLNLFNNAFYATQQKKAAMGDTYLPEVRVCTSCEHGNLEIRVRDNGTGISEKVRAKIFQPFFTTKPSGQGTGLGLSLSYDIITKGHGGELRVESREGEYSEFIIYIPASVVAAA